MAPGAKCTKKTILQHSNPKQLNKVQSKML